MSEICFLHEREREALEPPEDLTVSEWAEKYRRLDPKTSPEPGAFRNARTPYTREPMDAMGDPAVRKVTLLFGTQTGKTTCLENFVGWSIHLDPGPIQITYATKEDAKAISRKRYQVLINGTPVLKKYKTSNADDFGLLDYGLINCNIKFAWSNSPSRLSSDPIRKNICDEIAKYSGFAGREANPVDLAEERTKNFPDATTVLASTPVLEDDASWTAYMEGDQSQFYVPCPHCGWFQILKKDQVKWPTGCGHVEVLRDELAWYECEHCGEILGDADKVRMLGPGRWLPNYEGAGAPLSPPEFFERLTDVKYGSIRSFHLNSLFSPWVSFSKFAAKWLAAKNQPETLMNFVNSWLAEPWVDKSVEIKPEYLTTLCLDYGEATVPDGALVLTAGIDVGKDVFYYVIRGWGYGEESWMIQAGTLGSWAQVKRKMYDTYFQRAGGSDERIGVRLACIDSGYLTDEVYEFCHLHSDRVWAIKGQADMQGEFFRVKKIDKNPKTGKSYTDSRLLRTLDVNVFKDKINRMIYPGSDGGGNKWHLHANVSDRYLIHMSSERKIFIKGGRPGSGKYVWTQKKGVPNHYLDCEVYLTAAAHMIGVPQLQPESGTVQTLGMEIKRTVAHVRRGRARVGRIRRGRRK